jgi:hypothetical protein
MTDSHEIQKAHDSIITNMMPEQHPLVAAAIAAGAIDTESLGKLMDLQERYEANNARKEFAEAMIRLKRDLPMVIAHDAVVDYSNDKGRNTHYTNASQAKTMSEVVPCLTDHGFSISWNPSTPNDNLVVVECVLKHRCGHSESCTMSAPPDRKGGKNEAQARMSTVTLLQRYTATSILGIATADLDGIGNKHPDIEKSERVDMKKNLTALSYLKAKGISKEKAEEFVGNTVDAWTEADLSDLRDMIKNTQPEREPGMEG